VVSKFNYVVHKSFKSLRVPFCVDKRLGEESASLEGRAACRGRVPARVSGALLDSKTFRRVSIITVGCKLGVRCNDVGHAHTRARESSLSFDRVGTRTFNGDIAENEAVDGISPEKNASIGAVDGFRVSNVDLSIDGRVLAPEPPGTVP